jgi:Flp pilus assembly protein TadG
MGIRVASLLRSEDGQMAVELMVVLPVIIALVVIVVDCMVYLGDCSRFDRVACEAVKLHAASPDAAEYGGEAVIGAIQSDLEGAMHGSDRLSFSVTCDGPTPPSQTTAVSDVVSFVPQPRTYTCTLQYTPWPLVSGAFGVSPYVLRHTKACVVDPYRPGVVT